MGLTDVQAAGLRDCFAAAKAAGHPFPGIAAAEGALETATVAGGWFTSTLYTQSRNYLGLKAPSWYRGAVVMRPTEEFLATGVPRPGSWKNPRQPRSVAGGTFWTIDDEFCHFNTLDDCARAQMIVLQRGYASALQAASPEEFAREVSDRWSTGPRRGDVVVQIWRSHLDVLGGETAGAPVRG